MEVKWYLPTGPDVGMGAKPMLCEPDRAAQLDALYRRHGMELHEIEPQAATLAEQVYAYALGHADCGGWDVIVECWSLQQIEKSLSVWDDTSRGLRNATDLEDAIKNTALSVCVSIWADKQADAAVEGCTGDSACSYHEYHDEEPEACEVSDCGRAAAPCVCGAAHCAIHPHVYDLPSEEPGNQNF